MKSRPLGVVAGSILAIALVVTAGANKLIEAVAARR